MERMFIRLSIGAAFMLAITAPVAAQRGTLSSNTEKLKAEVILTTLAPADLSSRMATPDAAIEHKTEVARGTPLTAVLRANGCEKDAAGKCNLNAEVTVYKPDGSVFQQVKSVDLASGRNTVPLTFDAQAATGVYRVVVRFRDLTARRFAEVERQFGVK